MSSKFCALMSIISIVILVLFINAFINRPDIPFGVSVFMLFIGIVLVGFWVDEWRLSGR